MVKNGQLPNLEIGEIVANSFRDTARNFMDTIKAKIEDSRAPGSEIDTGAYSGSHKARGMRSDANDDQQGKSDNSHSNPDAGYSKRNPWLPPVSRGPGDEPEWINRHPERQPDKPNRSGEKKGSEGRNPDSIEGRSRNSERRQGQAPDEGNENKPQANPKPEPPLTCEDLERRDGKVPPSKLPPRNCPDYFSKHPVRPR